MRSNPKPEVLCWQKSHTPAELHSMLSTLSVEYPIHERHGKGINLTFMRSSEAGKLEVRRKHLHAVISYSTPAQAGRALSSLLSGLIPENSVHVEHTPFETFGIMLDCSRSAVITVDHLKRWMRQLALLGYNMIMLYTEDTYELEGEPWFGFQRGAYTRKELQEIDRYAAKLNIEMIPCIQTLGHLERILSHKFHLAYNDVKDTPDVLLVDEVKTYKLIDKMISHWKSVYCTNRIQIGMDETHSLGRGHFLERHGYERAFDLFNRHLKKVVAICKKHALKPMVWSDMYFRLGSKTNDYYDRKLVIPKDVIQKIPKEAQLCYWDYYHDTKEFYVEWIKRHRAVHGDPVMASGIQTWSKFWYDRRLMMRHAGPCIEACVDTKLKEILFTMWGDDGAYCDHDSAFAGMAWCADKAYSYQDPNERNVAKRFSVVCGGNYEAHVEAARLHESHNRFHTHVCMWDDPLQETYLRSISRDRTQTIRRFSRHYGRIAKNLSRYTTDRTAGNVYYAWCVASVMRDRLDFYADLLSAYKKKDRRAMKSVAAKTGNIIASLKKLSLAFRQMWHSHNKPQGIETVQPRFGALETRYREINLQLKEWSSGTRERLPELDVKCPPGDHFKLKPWC